ncbi:energy transducer TonB [Rufibacter roseolus]|uniref:energy transducer TonB n=1 Tax=Rufibacter roseolus TaxID=2817375 RepID=UPI001B3045FC|nr:energy transducer TonB [Rufibacter roseolus]
MRFRILLSLCLLVFLLQHAGAQVVPVTIYYDLNKIVTTKQKSAFIRVASLDTVSFKFKGKVTDYFANGQAFQQFTYGEAGKEGIFQLLHPNKKLDREGFFKENQPVGQWRFYYPDGKPMQTVEFLPNQDYKVLESYNFLGQQMVKDGTGTWETTSRIRVGLTFYDLLLEGQWKDGVKTGQWQFLKPDGKKVLVKEYENGIVKKRKLYDLQSGRAVETKLHQEDELWPFLISLDDMEQLRFDPAVFGSKERALQYILRKEHLLPLDSLNLAANAKVEKEPEFPGGQEAFMRFLGNNFRISPVDARSRVSGTVLVSFVVGVDGTLSDFKVVKSLSKGLDAEALRVLKLMPRWKPAISNGKPVPYTMTVPYKIMFGNG